MADVLAQLSDFAAILKEKEALAQYTLLKIGGPAEALATPRTLTELAALVGRCAQKKIVLRVLGGGGNVLDYTHFSVVISKSRRLARFTAVNIDGELSPQSAAEFTMIISGPNCSRMSAPRCGVTLLIG